MTALTQSQIENYRPEWIREDFVDFVLGQLNPLWSLRRVKARVERVELIADGMAKLTLIPNGHFQGYVAGQYILVSVQIDGVTHQRSYSLVSTPEDGKLCIAVKPHGKVSSYLAFRTHPGSVIEISQAQGDFVLSPDNRKPVLLIASGSGITPMLSLARQALQQSSQPVTLLYYSRDPAFLSEFNALKQRYPQFTAHCVNTLETSERFSPEALQGYCPDYRDHLTFVCGAEQLMAAVNAHWQSAGIQSQLISESFLPPKASLDAMDSPVTFRRSQRQFLATGNLLESAEQAGLKPAHGCRLGICNTCVCTKTKGTVRNQLTGELNSDTNVPVRLCITEAVGPVDIDL